MTFTNPVWMVSGGRVRHRVRLDDTGNFTGWSLCDRCYNPRSWWHEADAAATPRVCRECERRAAKEQRAASSDEIDREGGSGAVRGTEAKEING